MDLISYKKAKFEKNKLILDEAMEIDEWKELGQSLKQVEGSVQFWIGDWARFGDKQGFTGKYVDSKVYDELEELTGLSHNTIKQYKWVAEATSSNRLDDVSFTHHMEVAKLPEEKQVEFLTRASEEKLSVRELREEIKKEKFKEDVPVPEGVYRVIYADPPWKYNDKHEYNGTTGASTHYPTMSIEELCEMELPETEDDAVLFMWVTSPLLEDSFSVINSWGFKYKTSFVWDKVKHNMGHYNSVRHELLLVCTKGSCTPDVPKLFDSVISVERSDKHSEKPDEFREIIDTIYTTGNKVELFARTKKEGWAHYGNEL